MKNVFPNQSGQMTLYVLVFSAVSIIVLSGFVIWADANMRAVFRDTDKAQAFMIAEAGIEYYRWHLAHAQNDFQDGTGSEGPYVHELKDKDGIVIGSFSLDITAPPVGSTVVTINSTGTVTADSTVSKIIEAKMAIPSFAKYAVVLNSFVRFGEGTEIFGPIHSNGGVRMDGLAHNLVSSSVEKANDPDHSGSDEIGVHTHVAPIDPSPPAPAPLRPDVFMVGRHYPVAPIDFGGISHDLATIKTDAQSDGFYRGPSNDDGYHIILKTNDTFDLYRVTKILNPPNGCVSVLGQQDWDTWTIENQTLLGNYPFPENGLVFIEDDVWVEGTIDTARLTIAAAKFPENSSNYAHITTNNDVRYTNYDGQDSLSLIAQGNFNAGLASEDDLRVDAALIAQNGRVGRYYYRAPSGNQLRCGPYHTRQKITLYGMISSRDRYGFAYSDDTGYVSRIIIYDANLLYGPPPSFPLTADFYTPIFWNEKK